MGGKKPLNAQCRVSPMFIVHVLKPLFLQKETLEGTQVTQPSMCPGVSLYHCIRGDFYCLLLLMESEMNLLKKSIEASKEVYKHSFLVN